MEHQHFTICADIPRNMMRIVMRGFWDASTLAAYDAAITRVADQMTAGGCPRHEIVALVDARELNAQSQRIIVDYKEMFDVPSKRPRRLATIVEHALSKRQVQRIALPNQQIFANEPEALRWLLS